MSIFSANGSPTWTLDLLDSDSSVSSSEAKVAPWMPSRPVLEPRRTTRFPTPVARERTRSSVRMSPTHSVDERVAGVGGGEVYLTPTVGTPTAFP